MKKSILFAALLAAAWPLQVTAESVLADSTLHDVVVTGTRQAVPEREIIATVCTLDSAQLNRLERTNVLPTISELVPNLFVTQRGIMGYGVSGGAAGGISVRGMGSGSGQVMVLIDGHPQYQGIFGHSIADSYQTMMANRVEVVRGPASLFYGSNAMGGVINIITHQMETDGVNTDLSVGAGSYNSVQATAHNRVRAGRFFSDVALNYQGSKNHRPSMDYYQYGGFAKLGYDFTSHWRAWASVDLIHFAASNPGTFDGALLDARQWINRGVLEASVENHYGRSSGAVSVFHNFGRHKINDGHSVGTAPRDYLFRSQDALTGVNFYQGASLWKGNWVTVGFDYQNIHGECWNQSIETGERLNRKMEQNMHYPLLQDLTELAGYVDIRQDIASWFTVEAGLRYDHHSEAGGEWIPQGGFVVRPLRDGELKLSVGKGFRVPTLREMYLYGVANPDLEPERLWNYEAAWKHRVFGGRLSYGLNFFYFKADNLIAQTMVPELGKTLNYNTGKREHYGVEIEARYRACKCLTLDGNYSFLHMNAPLLAAPKHKTYFGAHYLLKALELSAGVQYVGGLYTNVVTEKRESFTLLNASVAYHLLPQVKLWVRGENLLAQKYEINEGFTMPRATVMAGLHVSF